MQNPNGRIVMVYGGSFDPPTIYHYNVCKYLMRFGANELRIIPAKDQPLKMQHIAPFEHRVKMLKIMADIAVYLESRDPFFTINVSTIENEREGKSYTSDTIKILKEREPDTSFIFVMGSDSLLNLHNWKDPADICNNVGILSLPRNTDEPSSTLIREALRGESSLDLSQHILPAVQDYIEFNKLYLG